MNCIVKDCPRAVEIKEASICRMHWGRQYRKTRPLFTTYATMKSRCYNSNNNVYKYYGGRGIKVCDRWLGRISGFNSFVKDMGPKPNPVYTLDRRDPYGDYSPENCRWVSKTVQSINKHKPAKGVFYITNQQKRHKRWVAHIQLHGKRHILGYFLNEAEAIQARKEGEKRYFESLLI